MAESLRDKYGRLPAGTLAEMYVILRDDRNELEQQKKLKQVKMDFLAGIIQQKLLDANQEGFRAKGHVVYPYDLETATVDDPEAFINHIKETGDFDLIARRAAPEACANYAANDPDGNPPPGVTLNKIRKLGVRKA
jgi:hypothetical protein